MLTLVIGGSASGKSTYAEHLAVMGPAPLYYIATMMPYDEESRRRIKKHQNQRAEKTFSTIECYTGLATIRIPERGTILLECLGNLAANELFAPEGAGPRTVEAIKEGFLKLEQQCDNLIVVSNDVFADGSSYDEGTVMYLDVLGTLNRDLSRYFERVVEVVCGIPILRKGEIA